MLSIRLQTYFLIIQSVKNAAVALTWQGGPDANAHECLKAISRDWHFEFVGFKMLENVSETDSKEYKLNRMGPGLTNLSSGSISLDEKICTDSLEALGTKMLEKVLLGSGPVGSPGRGWIHGLPIIPDKPYCGLIHTLSTRPLKDCL